MAKLYFYNENGEKIGIASTEELKTLVAQGVITPGTSMETVAGRKGLAGQMPGLFPVDQFPVVQSVSTKAPVPIKVDAFDEDESKYNYEFVATAYQSFVMSFGLFWLLILICGFLISPGLLLGVLRVVLTPVIIILFVVCIYRIIRLAKSLCYDTIIIALLVTCLFIPLIGWLILFVVPAHAGYILKRAGYKVGFLGAGVRRVR